MHFLYFCFFFVFVLQSCKSSFKSKSLSVTKGEYIYRQYNEELFSVEPIVEIKRDLYPWEAGKASRFPKITKEFFRCKGRLLNPVRIEQKGSEILRYYDCGGTQRHSLPIRDRQEFVYPILIDLLNYLQATTGKKVMITSGHCCPEHNVYLDSSPFNQTSKHLLGAEVDFYIEGMECEPEKIIELVQEYYLQDSKYKDLKEYIVFERFKSDKTNVRTPPWFNKEIFVKLVQSTEGRDYDNRHSYPYISVQVRYDWDLQEKVVYSWDKSFRSFYRR